MGNGITKVTHCFSDNNNRRNDIALTISDPLHEFLGHSFFYIRPEPTRISSSKIYSDHHVIQTTTFRSISGASVSANASTQPSTSLTDSSGPYSSVFEHSSTFESSDSFASVPLQPVRRRSGPMEGGFLSGPMDHGVEKVGDNKVKSNDNGLIKTVKRVILSSKFSCGLVSIQNDTNNNINESVPARYSNVSLTYDDHIFDDDDDDDDYDDDDDDDGFLMESLNVQWAQGKAGEDRVHIMISDKKGWVFVGIYDGFNGPDAPDYLLNNLYFAVRRELKGLLWNDKFESVASTSSSSKCVGGGGGGDHDEVLKALGEALRKTEEAYLEAADKMVMETPELSMMGSCVLVMLMNGDDVYLMNVGDSRAVLARKAEHGIGVGKARRDFKRMNGLESFDGDEFERFQHLTSLQLTVDHSTNVEEEVKRIKEEHPDDAKAISKDRLKGSLKVTRAFGAGFLKQPKWNDVVLEAFRVDYVGTSPYLTCSPSLYHHKLSPRDRFLILASDGLFDHFTNEEAVSEVESFIAANPTEDPAQHLIEQVLIRAARKAGMDLYELLDIPQGERRQYHDDVTVIIVSLEGRVWRSCVHKDINQ